MSISVLGAGSFGTALAIALARHNRPVMLWGHRSALVEDMRARRCNEKYLPGVIFPERLEVVHDLQVAVAENRHLLVVVPSHAFRGLLQKIAPYMHAQSKLSWATKGLEPNTGRLLGEVAGELLGSRVSLAVITGPTFAREVAEGLPTAVSVAATDATFANDCADLLRGSKSIRVYLNKDFKGLQLGGALKNVVAIGAGLSDGLGYGANARVALITRGIAEVARLGVAMGAEHTTFMGMAGLGDMVLTCTDDQSRNRRFGLAVGAGTQIKDAILEIGQVVEGYQAIRDAHTLSVKMGIDMPITDQLYQVMYQDKLPRDAARALMDRVGASE